MSTAHIVRLEELCQKLKGAPNVSQADDIDVHVFDSPDLHGSMLHWPICQLNSLQSYEQIEFLQLLVKAWELSASDVQALRFFEDTLNLKSPYLGTRPFFTLARCGTQFRCWYQRPSGMQYEGGGSAHFDAVNRGVIFSVQGDEKRLRKYVEAFPGTNRFVCTSIEGWAQLWW